MFEMKLSELFDIMTFLLLKLKLKIILRCQFPAIFKSYKLRFGF